MTITVSIIIFIIMIIIHTIIAGGRLRLHPRARRQDEAQDRAGHLKYY